MEDKPRNTVEGTPRTGVERARPGETGHTGSLYLEAARQQLRSAMRIGMPWKLLGPMSPCQSHSSSGRIVPLEGMRGFAALLVFFVHFSALLGSYARPQSLQYWITHFVGSMGNTGVDIFFVISGFLMYGIVMRKPTSLLHYLGRRARRLYPVFLFVLLIYIGISYVVPSASRIPSTRGAACAYILENAAMLPGLLPIKPIITVAWSLSYEWFFYLTLPLMVWAFQFRRKTPLVRIAMVLAICAVQYALVVVHVNALPRTGICLWELVLIGKFAWGIAVRLPRSSWESLVWRGWE